MKKAFRILVTVSAFVVTVTATAAPAQQAPVPNTRGSNAKGPPVQPAAGSPPTIAVRTGAGLRAVCCSSTPNLMPKAHQSTSVSRSLTGSEPAELLPTVRSE